jgi:RimJ/RimL family protein N-acetyltransferase
MYAIDAIEDVTLLKGDDMDTVPIGVCGLTDIDWVNRRAEFSLYIGREWHGKGLGRKALVALLDKGFDELNLNTIWGESFDNNPAQKMFLKVGMKHTGYREAFYYREGAYVHANLYSIRRDEWL